jgi:hypothetical protein
MAKAYEDKRVVVSFDEKAVTQFTFKPDSVTMKKPGKVKLERDDPKATWTFASGSVKEDTLSQFSTSVSNGGDRLTFKNECKDDKKTPYSYTITIKTASGSLIPSPDPEIVNDPIGT